MSHIKHSTTTLKIFRLNLPKTTMKKSFENVDTICDTHNNMFHPITNDL
jgi:hypothetical protein